MKSGKAFLACAMAALAVTSPAVAAGGIDAIWEAALTYQPLNPARGDASPQAGVLWGDLHADTPTGAIIKFKPGFSSPPHIHNITYRAIVIEGAVHNDDPDAKAMWMGPGSFWTQPAGENHITSAIAGDGATIFLETLAGPYLVQPSEEAFDNGERPINVDAGNVFWLNAEDITWASVGTDKAPGAELAFLWGSLKDNTRNGTFLKISAGTSGQLQDNGSQLHAVLIKGSVSYTRNGTEADNPLLPGSYFNSKEGMTHQIACDETADCVFYISTEGRYAFSSR